MNKAAINIIGLDKCTGCFGCYNSCSQSAIKMIISKKGFYIPEINNNKCNNCALCQKNCPIIQTKQNNFYENNQKIYFYAGFSKDDKIRIESSSGGIFTEIANYIIEDKGIVFGASWNQNNEVEHIEAKKKISIKELRGSKYVQSYVGNSYNKIVKYINEGNKVLFVGTPCQVSALKTFINHVNLYTIDLVCHGVPSLKIFKKYLTYKFNSNKIEKILFRDKKDGWSNYKITIKAKNKTYSKIYRFDPFFVGYLQNIYLNSTCYNCLFSQIPRSGDITLGDFWGAPNNLKDKKGVSIIIANNLKGKKLLGIIENSNKISLIESDFETATKDNPRIIKGNLEIPKKRENIFSNIDQNDFKYLEQKYIKIPNELKWRIRKYLVKIKKKLIN